MGTYVINRAANIAEGLGGGVATVIACSKPAALEQYATASSSGYYYGSWFRLYSDGFIEQGVITRDYWHTGSTDDNSALQFPIPFKDTNYTVNLNAFHPGSTIGYHNKTQYSIIPAVGTDAAIDTSYELCITTRGFVSQETIDNILAGKVWAIGPYDGTSPFHEWINDPNA